MKKEFGLLFIGGLAPDDFLRKYYAELDGEEDMSRRKAYTRNMHRAEICVNTQGTHHCWNFSFGEELEASRAIVTEKPFYEIPNYLQEEKNFLLYSDINKCVEQVHCLMTDREKLYEMYANKKYYENHLRPDCLVWDTIKDYVE